jgi:hypothetical protein
VPGLMSAGFSLRECRVGRCLDIAVDSGRLGRLEHPLSEWQNAQAAATRRQRGDDHGRDPRDLRSGGNLTARLRFWSSYLRSSGC